MRFALIVATIALACVLATPTAPSARDGYPAGPLDFGLSVQPMQALRGEPAAIAWLRNPTLPDVVQLDVPFYSQHEGGHGFVPGPRACFRAAVAMARDARRPDGEPAGVKVLGPRHRFQVGLAEDRAGRLTEIDEAAAREALRYIDRQLGLGYPVVVGVSHKHARYNVDALTDHFVVIDGRVSGDGRVVYTVLDPATRHPERARGELILTEDGRLVREGEVARGGVASRRLEVSMVRMNRT